ncbi:hypothetical protein IID62_04565 [candidate division KSB1 bacterium]|nr:hypothetical protein [candidate division KSB1 bacterium]
MSLRSRITGRNLSVNILSQPAADSAPFFGDYARHVMTTHVAGKGYFLLLLNG